MGFRPEPTLIKLNFKDSTWDGLEVTMKSVTVRQYSKMVEDSFTVSTGEEAAKANADLMDLFASKLVSWNLEDPDTGKAVPATRKGLDTVEANLFTAMVTHWQRALITVPPTSSAPSRNGARPGPSAQEESLGLGRASTPHQA